MNRGSAGIVCGFQCLQPFKRTKQQVPQVVWIAAVQALCAGSSVYSPLIKGPNSKLPKLCRLRQCRHRVWGFSVYSLFTGRTASSPNCINSDINRSVCWLHSVEQQALETVQTVTVTAVCAGSSLSQCRTASFPSCISCNSESSVCRFSDVLLRCVPLAPLSIRVALRPLHTKSTLCALASDVARIT